MSGDHSQESGTLGNFRSPSKILILIKSRIKWISQKVNLPWIFKTFLDEKQAWRCWTNFIAAAFILPSNNFNRKLFWCWKDPFLTLNDNSIRCIICHRGKRIYYKTWRRICWDCRPMIILCAILINVFKKTWFKLILLSMKKANN